MCILQNDYGLWNKSGSCQVKIVCFLLCANMHKAYAKKLSDEHFSSKGIYHPSCLNCERYFYALLLVYFDVWSLCWQKKSHHWIMWLCSVCGRTTMVKIPVMNSKWDECRHYGRVMSTLWLSLSLSPLLTFFLSSEFKSEAAKSTTKSFFTLFKLWKNQHIKNSISYSRQCMVFLEF